MSYGQSITSGTLWAPGTYPADAERNILGIANMITFLSSLCSINFKHRAWSEVDVMNLSAPLDIVINRGDNGDGSASIHLH